MGSRRFPAARLRVALRAAGLVSRLWRCQTCGSTRYAIAAPYCLVGGEAHGLMIEAD